MQFGVLLSPKPYFDLVLEHELLSESEAKGVSKRLNTPINKFPRISKEDPRILALKPEAGRLVAIKRNDPTGKYTYYRVVVESI